MRTIWRAVVLWLGSLTYGVSFPRVERWQGATLGWSPELAVAMATPSKWDGTAFGLDAVQQDTHRRLDTIEGRLHEGLDALLASVYQWRDTELV